MHSSEVAKQLRACSFVHEAACQADVAPFWSDWAAVQLCV